MALELPTVKISHGGACARESFSFLEQDWYPWTEAKKNPNKKQPRLIFIPIISLSFLTCTSPVNWFVRKNLKIRHNSCVSASPASPFLRRGVTYQLRPALYKKVCFYSCSPSRGKEGQNRLLQAKLNLCRAAGCHEIKPLTLSAVFIIRWPFLCVLRRYFDVLGHNRGATNLWGSCQ